MSNRYIGITNSLNIVRGAHSNIDAKYGPYNSIVEALAAIPSSFRKRGLTVGILNEGVVNEYWFKAGITDSDLILKIGEGGTVDLSEVFRQIADKVDKEPKKFLMTQAERDKLELLSENGNVDIEVLKALFLSKVEDDLAKGKITFEKGLESQSLTKLLKTQYGDFIAGIHKIGRAHV